MSILFSSLIYSLPDKKVSWDNCDFYVSGITYDSRKVKPGFIFVAVTGITCDGHNYIKKALEGGACGIVCHELPKELIPYFDLIDWKVPCVEVPDTRKTLSLLAAKFHGNPALKLDIIGVTGTNGKTTVTYILEEILKANKDPSGIIGTIGYKIGNNTFPATNTTPESLELQELLAQMLANGVKKVTMEVSSHALALSRVYSLPFDVAIFTNLTQDHLDFHGSMDAYREAKKSLFLSLKESKLQGKNPIAIINIDDSFGRELIDCLEVPCITYGKSIEANLQLRNIKTQLKTVQRKTIKQKTKFTICWDNSETELAIPLLGEFNVYNALAAIAAALSQGISFKIIQKALKKVNPVPGRFEQIDRGQSFTIIVDYAHTPDGLVNILKSVKEMTAGLYQKDKKCKIITVFGCGGDRDRGKRPKMGFIAGEYSDIVIITSDNPRNEDPVVIINEIIPGVKDAWQDAMQQEKARLEAKAVRLQINEGKKLFVEPDREKAIAMALGRANKNDIVVIAGKGHEACQIFKDKTIWFNDKEVVINIIDRWKMRSLTVRDVVEITDGTLLGGSLETVIDNISTDTRSLKPGALFIPLKGEKFDGHDFIPIAKRKGARTVLIEKEDFFKPHMTDVPSRNDTECYFSMHSMTCAQDMSSKESLSWIPDISYIKVKNTLKGYMELASYHRKKFPVPVIAVTGSNGKTTTKELISCLLDKRFNVLSAKGSFNNEIGVPKTLLELEPRHNCVVLELGMRGAGQIKELAETALPTIGIITNIGESHLEMLETNEGIMHAKGELLKVIPENGLAFLPAQDEWVKSLEQKCKCPVIYYGVDLGCKLNIKPHSLITSEPQYNIKPIKTSAYGETVLLKTPQGEKECQLKLFGIHNIKNAAGAMAVAMELGITLEEAAQALNEFTGVSHRLEVYNRPDGLIILDDTYNASPASMKEAIKVLSAFPEARQRFALLADMLELGGEALNYHNEIGRLAASSGIDFLVTYGKLAKEIGNGAREAGMADNKIKTILNKNESIKILPKLGKGDVVLVKGSRKMQMEKIVFLLLKDGGQ